MHAPPARSMRAASSSTSSRPEPATTSSASPASPTRARAGSTRSTARRPLAHHDVRQPRRRRGRPRPTASTGSPTSRRIRRRSWTPWASSARTCWAPRWAARSPRSSRLAHPGKVRSLVLNGTYCRGTTSSARSSGPGSGRHAKSDDLRDFLNVVNLWCFSPRIYKEGIEEEWLTDAAASGHAQSVDAFVRSADALIGHDSAVAWARSTCPPS